MTRGFSSILVPFLVHALSSFGTASPSKFDVSKYTNTIQAMPDYKLHWRIAGDSIEIAMETNHSGWVGFGISSAGGMIPADMVTAYIENGSVQVEDRYSTSNDAKMDCTQNWEKVSGTENAGGTFIEVKRKLDTGDSQDFPIKKDGIPTRVIFAHGQNSDVVGYHGATHRKTNRIDFFASGADATKTHFQKRISEPGVKYFDFLNQNYNIPAQTTTYLDFCVHPDNLRGFTGHHALPEQTVWIVGFEHIVQDSSAPYVHHFVMKGSSSKTDCDKTLYTGDMGMDLWAWAPGTQPMAFPDGVGMALGGSDTSALHTLSMQTHFDNPGFKSGIKDNSGVRVYYTTTKPTHEAAMLQVGDGQLAANACELAGNAHAELTCPSTCFKQDITVFSHAQHMHKLGNKYITTQIRGGKVLRQHVTEYYDFDFQDSLPIEPFDIKAGDSFKTECHWKPLPLGHTAKIGKGSDDEMCISFMMYYPKVVGLTNCGIQRPECTNNPDWVYQSDANKDTCMGTWTLKETDGNLARQFGECKSTTSPSAAPSAAPTAAPTSEASTSITAPGTSTPAPASPTTSPSAAPSAAPTAAPTSEASTSITAPGTSTPAPAPPSSENEQGPSEEDGNFGQKLHQVAPMVFVWTSTLVFTLFFV